MKINSKLSSRANESIDFTSVSRNRSLIHRPHIPKLRSGSNPGLNTSIASNTTENSFNKMQDSFSYSGKPPRVPMLKTSQMRQKEKPEILTETDDKFFYSSYKKHEIIKSRHISSSNSPFWYLNFSSIDELYSQKLKDSNRVSNFSIETLNSNLPSRSEFSTWLVYMTEKLSSPY